MEFIKKEEKEGVGIITLNRPEVYNSFNIPMALEVQELWMNMKKTILSVQLF